MGGPIGHPAQDLVVEADEVIAATGFRPSHAIAAELRLALEPGLESVAALSPRHLLSLACP